MPIGMLDIVPIGKWKYKVSLLSYLWIFLEMLGYFSTHISSDLNFETEAHCKHSRWFRIQNKLWYRLRSVHCAGLSKRSHILNPSSDDVRCVSGQQRWQRGFKAVQNSEQFMTHVEKCASCRPFKKEANHESIQWWYLICQWTAAVATRISSKTTKTERAQG